MTVEEYRAHPAANFSKLKLFLTSPAHYKAGEDEEKEETDAMRIGSICHSLVLEGKKFDDLYAIKPAGMSFATKEGKAWRDAQTKPILKEEDANSIPRIAEAIAANPAARKIIESCPHRETPIFGTIQGVPCKSLIDFNGQDWGIHRIGDLKSTLDASPRAFGKTVAQMHYDLQYALSSSLLALQHGLESPPEWFWIAAEKKAPFYSQVYTAEEFYQSGMEKLERVLTLFKECQASGNYPFAMTGIHILPKPHWA